MPTRGPFPRALVVAALVVGGLVAVVGGLALRSSGLVAIVFAGALAGCLGWGMARETPGRDRRAATEVAVLAVAWTVGALLVLSGLSVLVGGMTTTVLAGIAAVGGLVWWMVRSPADVRAGSGTVVRGPWTPGVLPMAPPAAPRVTPGDRPVAELSTAALGEEWLTTTAALGRPLDAASRQSVVARRQEALDELERRDPEGFSRWLAAGPEAGSDPADFVRGGEAAGTDAA